MRERRRKTVIHLVMTAYAILLSAALATAQHNPQTDTLRFAPRPQSGENTVIRDYGSGIYINNEMMVAGGARPKDGTETLDYKAMAATMARNLLSPMPKIVGPDGQVSYLQGPQESVEALCVGLEYTDEVKQCQAWNESGTIIKMTCHPDGCLVDGVFSVKK
jgi:hypothetical protein